MKPASKALPGRQRGSALAVALVLLIAMSIVTLFTGRTMIAEQRMSANSYRSMQAFEAAEAGLEAGIALATRYNRNDLYTVSGTEETVNGREQIDVSVDTDGNGSGDTPGYTATLANGAIYSVAFRTFTDLAKIDTLRLKAVGTTDDATGTRSIIQLLQYVPMVVNPPPVPLVARTTVDFSGNVDITNNDTAPYETIWAGGGINLSGAASTETNGSTGSDSGGNGADVVENEPALNTLTGDQFFEGFFGASKAEVQQGCTVYTGAGNYSGTLDGVTGQGIWIDGAGGELLFNSNTQIGTPSRPVILVATNFSEFRVNGNLTIYGMVYVIGDWVNVGGGTATIHGAALSEGSISGTGTPNPTFNSDVLDALKGLGMYAKIPGSWRDF